MRVSDRVGESGSPSASERQGVCWRAQWHEVLFWLDRNPLERKPLVCLGWEGLAMIFPALSLVLEWYRSSTDGRLPPVTFWADRKVRRRSAFVLGGGGSGPDADG